MSTGPGLRERRREETLAAIRAAAHRELVEHGAAALSLRAVARDVGMAVSALYRYYAGRDELLTDLWWPGTPLRRTPSRSGADLGTGAGRRGGRGAVGVPVVVAGAPGRVRAALRRSGARLRARRPHDPGRCPGRRHARGGGGRPDRRGLVDAEGAVARPGGSTARRAPSSPGTARRRGYDLPDAVVALLFDGFVRLHGVVVMEVFGQLRPLTDRPEDYVACLVDGIVTDLVGEAGARGLRRRRRPAARPRGRGTRRRTPPGSRGRRVGS